jgi:membrane-bound metal-dependent hydrolase YbcI (DUF457 family)
MPGRETHKYVGAAAGLALGEFIWILLAGFLNGLAAGYVSHLLLDATTPLGTPILGGRAALKI